MSVDHLCVVVPAANEQDTVAACLRSVEIAIGHLRSRRPEVTSEVVVVLDRCTDGTEELVRQRPSVTIVVSSAGKVGAARQHGSRLAMTRAEGLDRVWTAHTDADSTVPSSWLVDQLTCAEAGADLVLGTVWPDLDEPLRSQWLARHTLVDGHRQVHGANLGIRANVLLALGGWPNRAQHEDAELVRRAETANYRITRVGGPSVRTSGRLVGRTPGGMAGYLWALAEDAQRAEPVA